MYLYICCVGRDTCCTAVDGLMIIFCLGKDVDFCKCFDYVCCDMWLTTSDGVHYSVGRDV